MDTHLPGGGPSGIGTDLAYTGLINGPADGSLGAETMELVLDTSLAFSSCSLFLPHLSGKAQGRFRRNATPG